MIKTDIENKIVSMKNMHKLPIFKSLNEMDEFWDSHEFTEFKDDFREIEHAVVDIKERSYLPITLMMYEKPEKIASKQNTTVDRLIQR